MTSQFTPFTPELFKSQTGLDAHENEAIYIRWVNTQINLANYQALKEMTSGLKEIIRLLKENSLQHSEAHRL